MNKMYMFSVTDCENFEKPLIYCKIVDNKPVKDQKTAEQLISEYVEAHMSDLDETISIDDELEDLAYTMRKNGAAWLVERFCFELTEVDGQQANVK